jgi:hypothetical protein
MDLQAGIAPQGAGGNPAAEVVPNPVARNSQPPRRRAIGRNSALAGGRDERPLAGQQLGRPLCFSRARVVRQHPLGQGIANDAGGIAPARAAGLPAIKLAPGFRPDNGGIAVVSQLRATFPGGIASIRRRQGLPALHDSAIAGTLELADGLPAGLSFPFRPTPGRGEMVGRELC